MHPARCRAATGKGVATSEGVGEIVAGRQSVLLLDMIVYEGVY